jgi:hypothetical protein
MPFGRVAETWTGIFHARLAIPGCKSTPPSFKDILFFMKKSLALASLAIALTANLSCEQQTWDQTKMFNQNRHSSGHGEAHSAAAPAEHTPAAH